MDIYQFDKQYFGAGVSLVAGVDECGRGCLAGPVAAAAVILPESCLLPGLKDSKKMSAKQRCALYPMIMENAVSVSVALVEAWEIDELNIHHASLLAMKMAVDKLSVCPEIVLVDGRFLPDVQMKAENIIAGDQKSACIAAASVIAKVTRDRLMGDYASIYTEYGFDKHKGYATAAHYAALSTHGSCPIHRQSFRLK